MGAVVGVSLVGQNTSAPDPTDQALAVGPEKEVLPLQDAEVGVYGIQTARLNSRSAGSRRARGSNFGPPRAYRFAVIR